MSLLGIIGGTGLTTLNGLEIIRREVINTPYGEPSGPVIHGRFCKRDVVFLARHGYKSNIPPHRVNYRANIWAIKELGIDKLIAVNAVGGIRKDLNPGSLVIPHQIIDYTWERGHTFFEDGLKHVVHIDFTYPYCKELRNLLLEGAKAAKLDISDGAVYGATQGPRLETSAEIDKLEKDGCDVVGMTGMPETALAREMEICYASVNVIANMGAGRGNGVITMREIEACLVSGMADVKLLIENTIPLI